MKKVIFFIKRAKKKIFLLGTVVAVLGYMGHFVYVKRYVIDKEQLGNVIAYLYVASLSTSSDNKLREHYASVLARFNVTPNQFIKSINYYSKDLHKIYQCALDEILIEKEKIES